YRAWGRLHSRDIPGAAEDILRAEQLLGADPMCWRMATSLAIAQGDRTRAGELIAKLRESTEQSVFCDFKQALFMLWDGRLDEALRLYTEAAVAAKSDEMEIALLDLDHATLASSEIRQRARQIVQTRYTPSLGLLDFDFEVSSLNALLI